MAPMKTLKDTPKTSSYVHNKLMSPNYQTKTVFCDWICLLMSPPTYNPLLGEKFPIRTDHLDRTITSRTCCLRDRHRQLDSARESDSMWIWTVTNHRGERRSLPQLKLWSAYNQRDRWNTSRPLRHRISEHTHRRTRTYGGSANTKLHMGDLPTFMVPS